MYTSRFFYSVQIETNPKPSKEAAAKNFFFGLYVIDATCFDECFLSHVISGRRYFFYKLVLTLRFFNRHIFIFFETSVLEKVHILYFLRNNNTILIQLIPKFRNVTTVYYTYIWETFVANLFYDKVFYTMLFFDCLTLQGRIEG